MKKIFLFILICISYLSFGQIDNNFNTQNLDPKKEYYTNTKEFRGNAQFKGAVYYQNTSGDTLQLYVDETGELFLAPPVSGGSSDNGSFLDSTEIKNLIVAASLYKGPPTHSTKTVENIPANTDLTQYTLEELIANQYAPFIAPTFSAFTITGQSTTVPVGTVVSGIKEFAWSFNNSGNVQANTLDIRDVTNGVYLETNISVSSPSFTDVGSVTKTTQTSHSWRVEATDIQGNTFVSSDFSINWRFFRHWGFSNAPPSTSGDILNLPGSELSTNHSKTLDTGSPTGNQYFSFTYPTSFGTLSSITVNGFPSIASFTQSTVSHTDALGVTTDYYLYVSNNTFNSSATIVFD